MIRDSLGNTEYWDKWTVSSEKEINDMLETIRAPSGNSSYRPQYVYEISQENYEQMLRRYSRGDPISELPKYFLPLLDMWEKAEYLGKDVWTEEQQYIRHSWAVNLDHYIVCFWLVGLALAFNIPEDQWQRLIFLIGNDGEDTLLDKIIATRQPDRKIGEKLCHPNPYQRLLRTIEASTEKRSDLLYDFVSHWYQELDRAARENNAPATAMYERPYWYNYGSYSLEGGAYFGQWCVEAVAAVKAFNIDDSLCLGHKHYPGDLLRPDKPSTHKKRYDKYPMTLKATLKKWIGKHTMFE